MHHRTGGHEASAGFPKCVFSGSAYACCDRCRDPCATIIKHSHFCSGGTYVTIKASLRFPSRLARERAPTNGPGHGQGTKRGDERLQRAGHHLKSFEKAASAPAPRRLLALLLIALIFPPGPASTVAAEERAMTL